MRFTAARLTGPEDVAGRARVAVLGGDVAKELFPGTSPVGQPIQLAGVPFVVIGTLASRGAGPGGASLDDLILVPVTTAATRLFNRDYLTMLIAQLRDPEHSDGAVARIIALLRQRHHLAPQALDDFSLSSPKAVATRVTQATSTLARLVWGCGLLVTAIGAAMVIGIMLAGVSERRAEIGLRRAIGATRGDILSQFLLEALWASLAGGIVGVGIGAISAFGLTRLQHLPTVVSGEFVGIAFTIAMAVGSLAGLYPAWKAKVLGHIPGRGSGMTEKFFQPGFDMVAHAEEFAYQAKDMSDAEIAQFAKMAKRNGTWLTATLTTGARVYWLERNPYLAAYCAESARDRSARRPLSFPGLGLFS